MFPNFTKEMIVKMDIGVIVKNVKKNTVKKKNTDIIKINPVLNAEIFAGLKKACV